MNEERMLLPERISRQFLEMDNDMIMELLETSPRYAKLKEQIDRLTEENPSIRDLIDGEDELHLSSMEHKKLLKYFELYRQSVNLEHEHLYFRGHMDCFAFLKRIGAFQNE